VVVVVSLGVLVLATGSIVAPVSPREFLPGVLFSAIAGFVLVLELLAVAARSCVAARTLVSLLWLSELPVVGNLISASASTAERLILIAVGGVVALLAAGHVRWWRTLRAWRNAQRES
jgi:hypothetical protein